MNKNAAIIAHFDFDHQTNNNFLRQLKCLSEVFDILVLVTTSDIDEHKLNVFKNLVLIKRPNMGYDFYSYRVGITYLRQRSDIAHILLINSSLTLLNDNLFLKMLSQMKLSIPEYDVIGVTQSKQFKKHIQSYMIFFNQKIIKHKWFNQFIDNIQPKNTKLEIIIDSEIALSQLLFLHNSKIRILFKPTLKQGMSAYKNWWRIIIKKPKNLLTTLFFHWNEVNWVHFSAKGIAEQFGFIKTDLLRTNPHNVSVDFIYHLSKPSYLQEIKTIISASRKFYKKDKDGLTTLSAPISPLPEYRMIKAGNNLDKNVQLAVIIHLYYFDLLEEIILYLKNIIEPYDLYITTPFEGDIHKIINKAHSIANSLTIFLTENRGRDVGPFLAVYHTGILDRYRAVLKLHSKKSNYSEKGALWRKQIYQSLIGNSLHICCIINAFRTKKLGILGPEPFFLSHHRFWGANYDKVKERLPFITPSFKNKKIELGFFAGSMFWFNPKCLSGLKQIPEEFLVFETENGAQDGSLAHAFERIFCLTAKEAGYLVTDHISYDKDIFKQDNSAKTVPVLED